METARLACYPARNERTAFRTIQGEAVILNLDNGFYYSLNEVGSKVWDLCDGSKKVADIAAAVRKEFDVHEDTAEKDILELLDDLVKEGLVCINENPVRIEPA